MSVSTSMSPRQQRFAARFTRNVAPGIHRLEHAHVNCYLIEGSDGLTIVDAAFPSTWPLLKRAIRATEHTSADVRAIVLTHAHFDHLGFAERAHREWGIPVWAHGSESSIAEHPYGYKHERARLLYLVRHRDSASAIFDMIRAGALHVQGLAELRVFEPDQELDVPGRPRVVFTPGHTFGHSALRLPDRDTVISGDALVTLDPYTGMTGPRIVSGAATADSTTALDSLDALERTGATLVLPGHGHSWREGIGSAVAAAKAAGPS